MNPVTIWPSIASHDPARNGWGKPFSACEWLIELDKHHCNVIVEELVFHLEHGASVERIRREVGKYHTGVALTIMGNDEIFLPVSPETLESHWNECQKITSGYPQLSGVIYQT